VTRPEATPPPDDPEDDGHFLAEDPVLERLPLGWRIFFLLSGWILFLIGVAGLALPGIQGILTILFGFALIGMASKTAHGILERLLGRWPRLWEPMEELRAKIFEKLRE
jgi:hypothetical protein